MKDPPSEKLNKHSKNIKVLSSIKKDAFTHVVIPKGLPKSSTSKETVGVAEVSSCSACHSNSGISKTTITAVLKPLSEQVVISEIHCAVYVVYHYHSLCSSGGMAALFQEVFPDKCSCSSRVLSIFGKTFIYDQPWFSSLFQSCNLE